MLLFLKTTTQAQIEVTVFELKNQKEKTKHASTDQRLLSNSLKIHEENSKDMNFESVFVNRQEIRPDLHKLYLRFSRL